MPSGFAVPVEVGRLDPSGALVEAAEAVGGVSRRALLVGATVAGLGVLAPAAYSAEGDTDARGSKARDVKVLNFALTLEYLQAAFYTEAERRGALHGENARAAKMIGAVERAHVAALTEILGAEAVKEPFFDFQGTTENDEDFVKTAVGFEDFSAAAYQGALPLLSQPAVIAGAASIHTVEARHAAWLRFLHGFTPAAKGLDDPISHAEALSLVAATGFVRDRPEMEVHSAPGFAG